MTANRKISKGKSAEHNLSKTTRRESEMVDPAPRKRATKSPQQAKTDTIKSKQAEVQPEQQNHILQHINDAVIAVDAQSRITSWNRAAENLYGWAAEEALGHPSTEIVPSN